MATAHPMPSHLDELDLVDNDRYAVHGQPHDAWRILRREAPVYWYDRPDFEPFWAITKHADIVEIGKNPTDFIIKPRLAAFREQDDAGDQTNHLLTMDPPEHGRYRRVTSKWFTPRMTQQWAPEVERITHEILGGLEGEREVDFVGDVAAPITIAVIAEMLGLPRDDWRLLFRWTNETIAPNEPEFAKGRTARETTEQAREELFTYFKELSDERRENPRDDIISVVARGEVDGAEVPLFERLSYYLLLVVAGNETTRNAMTGGMLALLDNPEEWQKLRSDAALVDPAVEEIVRWTTPVNQFCRTATRDTEVRGQRIAEGESVCLFYASANRDEDVFDDPYAFRVDRTPNDHIGFGRGEHVCLGAHLARLELQCMYGQLRERLRRCEAAGDPARIASSFVPGFKRAPLNWDLAPA